MRRLLRRYAHPWGRWVLRQRMLKFGMVGASGTFVNLGVLYASQEYFFRFIESAGMRLNASLAVAILFATVNNFLWNRAWTWRDRRHLHRDRSVLLQFGQYAMACWLGVALQFVITKLLAVYFHYLLANIAAIVLASVFNFVVNNVWTFRHRDELPRQPPATSRASGDSTEV